jgi:hypothetical protein
MPDVGYRVFDRWDRSGGYRERISDEACLLPRPYGHAAVLFFAAVRNAREALKCEQSMLAEGRSGVLCRHGARFL